MNIAQLSEQLKDVPQNRLVDYARNPNSVVPQFLALAEIQRRQHLQNTPQPPAATVAEDVLAQAAPQQMAPQQMAQQLPENQPGVAQLPTGMPQGMASGGIVAFAGGGMSDGYDNEDEYDLDEKQANREESRIRSLIAGMRARVGNAVADVPRAVSAAIPTAIAGIPRAVESAASGIKSFASNLPKSYEAEKAKPTSGITSFKSKGSHPFETQAIAAAKEVGLDPNLMLHALYKETGGHKDPATAISKAGAYGPMQLMEAAAKEVGVNRKDAYENLLGGARYLKKQVDTFGDDTLALAAYNAGPGRVRQMLKRNQGIESLPPETQGYVKFAQGGIASIPRYDIGGDIDAAGAELDALRSGTNTLYEALMKGGSRGGSKSPELQAAYENALAERNKKQAAYEFLMASAGVDKPSFFPQSSLSSKRPEPNPIVQRQSTKPALVEGNDTNYISPTYQPFGDDRDFASANQGITPLSGMSYADLPFDILGGKPPQGGIGPFDYEMGRFPEQAGPSRPSYVEEALARINQDREDLKAQAGQDKYLAMLQAGLGMMSGTSPYAMANIGQGGMQGVAAYAGAKKQRALERLALGKEELSVRRLEQLSDSEKAALEVAAEDKRARAKLGQSKFEQEQSEFDRKRIEVARDDLKQYLALQDAQLKARFPMGEMDPKYAKARADLLSNDPIIQQLQREAFPRQYNAPAASPTSSVVKTYNQKTGKVE
jgi:soluble lytic murein transglycosylase-like protein